MESLTKENFWNELYAKYPEQMKVFCAWIDEYKKRVQWPSLFKDVQRCVKCEKNNAYHLLYREQGDSAKFHDLPIGMQIGIFLQFTFETEKKFDFFEDGVGPLDMEQFVAGIKDWFHQEASEDGDEPEIDEMYYVK